ncbi:DUF5712 family protein [Dysgonomonas massiliensis]|uniref:DUF5712 family protein n=1 Tax=Dysgonomonas massiliensis TaxID=2040292 RepID=UPI000C791A28|nr:DUF5712 family protein [Dysgonomonas massiliensis]
MNVKIQGGDEVYSNTGSCYNVVCYLEHEDYLHMLDGEHIEPFFSQDKDDLRKKYFVPEMDNNKAKLCRKDAKFYVLTVSPSQQEIEHMGTSQFERSEAFKRFIREQIISVYAKGFGKDLTADDILYFAKIHHSRKSGTDRQMHAHIVVSRKTKDNRIKISPRTNHRKGQNSGAVKSGFDRTQFYQKVEEVFDQFFSYSRQLTEKFAYLNTVKNNTIEELENYLKSEFSDSEPIQEHKQQKQEQHEVIGLHKQAINQTTEMKKEQPKGRKRSKRIRL